MKASGQALKRTSAVSILLLMNQIFGSTWNIWRSMLSHSDHPFRPSRSRLLELQSQSRGRSLADHTRALGYLSSEVGKR